MQLGLVGLGRMGSNMTRRLIRGGHEITVFDLNAANVQKLTAEGGRRSHLPGGFGEETPEAAGRLGDGAGRKAYRRYGPESGGLNGSRRHDYRWRE